MLLMGSNGGMLGVRKTPTYQSAPGMWTPNEQTNWTRTFSWPNSANDPYAADVLYYFRFNENRSSGQSVTNTVIPIATGVTTSNSLVGASTSTSVTAPDGSGTMTTTGASNSRLAITLPVSLGTADFCLEMRTLPFGIDKSAYEAGPASSNRASTGGFAIFTRPAQNNAGQNQTYMSCFNLGVLSLGGWGNVPVGTTYLDLCVQRTSGVWKLFVFGSKVAEQTVSSNQTQTSHIVGWPCDNAPSAQGSHRYDFIRLTRATRYTSDNFGQFLHLQG